MGFFDFFKSRSVDQRQMDNIPAPPKQPLILFAEMPLEHTSRCRSDLRLRANVEYNGAIIGFLDAIQIYYQSPDIYFPWSFSVQDISLQRTNSTYEVYGDGLMLGTVLYSKYNDSYVRMLDDLIYINKIHHCRCEINDCKYFYLNEEEYKRYVQSDPFNRGFPSWAADRSPSIKFFVYFEDGVINLEDYGTNFDFPQPEDYF